MALVESPNQPDPGLQLKILLAVNRHKIHEEDVAEYGIVDPLKSTCRCSELESAMCSFVQGVVLSTRNYQLLNMKAGSGYGREHPANWSLS